MENDSATEEAAASLDPMLTLEQFSAYLQTPKSTLYSLRSEGRGPVRRRIGRNLRFRRSDVELWLDSLPTTADAA